MNEEYKKWLTLEEEFAIRAFGFKADRMSEEDLRELCKFLFETLVCKEAAWKFMQQVYTGQKY